MCASRARSHTSIVSKMRSRSPLTAPRHRPPCGRLRETEGPVPSRRRRDAEAFPASPSPNRPGRASPRWLEIHRKVHVARGRVLTTSHRTEYMHPRHAARTGHRQDSPLRMRNPSRVPTTFAPSLRATAAGSQYLRQPIATGADPSSMFAHVLCEGVHPHVPRDRIDGLPHLAVGHESFRYSSFTACRVLGQHRDNKR